MCRLKVAYLFEGSVSVKSCVLTNVGGYFSAVSKISIIIYIVIDFKLIYRYSIELIIKELQVSRQHQKI